MNKDRKQQKKEVSAPFTKLYTWWWKSGVGYKKAGEIANQNWIAKKNESKR